MSASTPQSENVKLKFPQGSDVIFTSYFTSKENPQLDARGQRQIVPKNDLNYIAPWYVSVTHHKMKGVVFHDHLSADFIAQHETDNLQFIAYHPDRYSLNDERYLALDAVLKCNRLGKVMLTDACDLQIKKNPFDFFVDPNLLYFGTDVEKMPRIRDNPWCLEKSKEILLTPGLGFSEDFLEFEIVNAGVFGGSYELVKAFNEGLVSLFHAINNDRNNNMMVINYLLWKLKVPHFKGPPLTSPFKKFDVAGDYYIVHK